MILTRTAPVTPVPLLRALIMSALAHIAGLVLLPGLRTEFPTAMPPLSVDFRLLPKPEEIEPPKPERAVPALPRKPNPPPPPRVKEPAPPKPAPPPVVQPRHAPEPAPPPVVESRDATPPPQTVEPAPPRLITAPAESTRPRAFGVPAPASQAPAQRTPSRENPPAAPVPVEPNRDALVQGYGRQLSRALEPHRRYPRIAQIRGWQGTVEMRVQVLPGGRLGDVTVERSSGHAALDEQALAMVRDATLPPVPEPLDTLQFSIRLPVEFRLRD